MPVVRTVPGGGSRPVADSNEADYPVSVSLDLRKSDLCGPTGVIHFDFQTANQKDFVGTWNIHMSVLKNGVMVHQHFYPNLNVPSSAPSFDFNLTSFWTGVWCAAEPANAGGLDFAFEVTFTLPNGGTTVRRIGTAPEGFVPGLNNDYRCSCDTTPPSRTEPKLEHAGNIKGCGNGEICFNYVLPTNGGTTGTAVIDLVIFQNGSPVHTISSGPFGAQDNGFNCFIIQPSAFPAPFNPALGGFDFVANATFTLGNQVTTRSLGRGPDGMQDGVNNDWRVECPPPLTTPSLTLEPTSSNCGKGELCFKYAFISGAGSTGSLTLAIYQDGNPNPVSTMPPIQLSSAHQTLCIPIDPAVIPGLDPSKGFDWVATGTFTQGGQSQTLHVGSSPNGHVEGKNNDYARSCEQPGVCCDPRTNIFKDGDFERRDDFESDYASASLDQLLPGTYSVAHLDKLEKACSNWQLSKECRQTKDFVDQVLVVNGLTNQAPGTTHRIFASRIELPEKIDYSICFHYLPLQNCCFNVSAVPVLHVVGNHGNDVLLENYTDTATGCGHTVSARVKGGGVYDIEIYLPADGNGDGNDLIIDNIIVSPIHKAPAALAHFDDLDQLLNNGSIKVMPANGNPVASPYQWVWECFDITGLPLNPNNVLPQSAVFIGSSAVNAPDHTFTGLNPSHQYWIRMVVWSDCETKVAKREIYGSDESLLRKADTGPAEEVSLANRAAEPVFTRQN